MMRAPSLMELDGESIESIDGWKRRPGAVVFRIDRQGSEKGRTRFSPDTPDQNQTGIDRSFEETENSLNINPGCRSLSIAAR